MTNLPEQFVYLPDIDDSIQYDIKYASQNNLVGRVIKGYLANVCICTHALALALQNIQIELKSQNLELMVYETFRPQRASKDLAGWLLDPNDQINKADYYPNIDKALFYQQNYIMEYSAHTRGSTVDLSIIDSTTETLLDMGTCFDFMDVLSHPDNQKIGQAAFENRQFLKTLMHKHGFEGLATEWWHFTLKDEPFPDKYFDFDVR